MIWFSFLFVLVSGCTYHIGHFTKSIILIDFWQTEINHDVPLVEISWFYALVQIWDVELFASFLFFIFFFF